MTRFSGRGLSEWSVRCGCARELDGSGRAAGNFDVDFDQESECQEVISLSDQPGIEYHAHLDLPLIGEPLRVGRVLYLPGQCTNTCFSTTNGVEAQLVLYVNGLCIQTQDQEDLSVAWTPFALVQACRWHNEQTDAESACTKLFKVSIFHHGTSHFFAVKGDDADEERARWVAEIACALRILTLSLFPEFDIVTRPIKGFGWTATRILAGFLLHCVDRGVRVVYCELHAHWNSTAVFGAYDNACCDMRTMRFEIDQDTVVGERMAIDCSCFSMQGQHFSSRTSAEKALWLRAISNVKVKLRHRAGNPSSEDLANYRAAVLESAQSLNYPAAWAQYEDLAPNTPLMPVKNTLQAAARMEDVTPRSRTMAKRAPARSCDSLPQTPPAPSARSRMSRTPSEIWEEEQCHVVPNNNHHKTPPEQEKGFLRGRLWPSVRLVYPLLKEWGRGKPASTATASTKSTKTTNHGAQMVSVVNEEGGNDVPFSKYVVSAHVPELGSTFKTSKHHAQRLKIVEEPGAEAIQVRELVQPPTTRRKSGRTLVSL